MSQTLIVIFDGEAFYPETHLALEPNKRYQIQILEEENPLSFQSQKEIEEFLDEAERAFIALRNDPIAWEEELAERQAWESTIVDGNED